jgi:hypothetical protein
VNDRNAGGGGMTGATGDLTPDDAPREFEPGELREVSDPMHQAEVTQAQGARAPALTGDIGDPGGDLEVGVPAVVEPEPEPSRDREPRVGGDVKADHEEHF